MKAWPLRTKLTLWSAFVTGLALLTLAAVTTVSLYFAQIEGVDDHLAAESELFFAALPAGPGENAVPPGASLLRRHNEVLHGFAIGPTGGRATEFYPADIASLAAVWPPARGVRMAKLDGKYVRVGVFTERDRSLLLVADLESVREALAALLGAYGVALPLVLIVVAVGSSWIARRALRPITDITAAAGVITAERLDARLPLPAADDEIGRHIRVLNEMFDRLQRSFEQATRFAADASHELRTPLTILRGEIEEALLSNRGDGEQEKLLVSLLEQTSGLQKIADNLLLLARFDAGKAPLDKVPVDLSALVAEAVDDAEMLAALQSIKILATIAPGVRVDGDALLLRRVLLNLVDNAVRYNRPEGEVRFALETEGAEARLTLTNTGPGIPEERRSELFQRFFRLNTDRNRGTGGSGLGLSLCREIVSAHGGRIELASSEPDCTRFTVRLSALPASS
jgi:two-component system, OmpR family, heavy metal sensor histidine kinase CusS